MPIGSHAPFRVPTLLLLLLPLFGPSLSAKDAPKARRWKGTSLAKVLKNLREYDLNIVFSSAVVKRRMKVLEQPTTADKPLDAMSPAQRRAFLEEVLAQHGLTVRDGPSQTLIVVKRNDQAALDYAPQTFGTVLNRESGRPVAGVRIFADQDADRAVSSNERGAFLLPWRHGPPKTLTLEREGFLPLTVTLRAGDRFNHFNVEIAPIPRLLEELVVTPSTYTLLSQGPENQVVFSKEEIDLLPRLSDDLYRAIGRLPGTAGGDFSSKFTIRGGEENEVIVLLDGIEIFDPFHLKDLQNIFSVFDSEAIDEVTFLAGGYPVEYGNALSGVIDLKTKQPQDPWQTELGVSFLNSHVRSSDRFADGRGRWLVSARNGYLDIARAIDKLADLNFNLAVTQSEDNQEEIDTNERFKFRDILVKVAFAPNARWDFSLNLLAIDDLVRYDEKDGLFGTRLLGNVTDANFKSIDNYIWLRAEAQLSEKLSMTTLAAYSVTERGRAGIQERDDDHGFILSSYRLNDQRETEFFEIQQQVTWRQSDSIDWRFGVALRSQFTEFDYQAIGYSNEPLISDMGTPVSLNRSIQVRPSGEQAYTYAAVRTGLSTKWQADLGLRYDWQSYIKDDAHQISPRVNLGYQPWEHTQFRFAWGLFHQAPRTPELGVADGETEFYPVQHAQHVVLAWDQGLRGGWHLRSEAYFKDVADPRPRYENRYTPVALFPESEDDRIFVDPESAKSYGFELFVKSNPARRTSTWASYSYGHSREKIDGHWFARNRDQRHALQLGLNFALDKRWHLSLAASGHSGWPTTDVWGEAQTNEAGDLVVVPVYGERNALSSPSFARLDMRLSYYVPRRRGGWNFFLEINNILRKENVCCRDHTFEIQPDGSVTTTVTEEFWLPLIPSFGATRRW